jgi:Bacteriophage tail assembly protein
MKSENAYQSLPELSVTTSTWIARKARKKQARRFLPPPKLSVSEWADQERVLSTESSAQPGKWRTITAPYLQGPMDAISDPGTEEVVIMSAAQVGKNECLLNTIGRTIDRDPAPILFIMPSAEMAQAMSKDRITQQVSEGSWGIKIIGRDRYVLSEDEKSTSVPKRNFKISDQQRLDYENEIRDRLDQIRNPSERIQLICILAEMELDRLRPKEKWPEFNDEEKDLNDEEIDWLLLNCYQVGLISNKDLLAMCISIKKSFEALKTIVSLDELILKESA